MSTVYANAIDSLEGCFVGLQTTPYLGAMSAWLIEVGKDFLDLLWDCKPMPLFILPHFTALYISGAIKWELR